MKPEHGETEREHMSRIIAEAARNCAARGELNAEARKLLRESGILKDA